MSELEIEIDRFWILKNSNVVNHLYIWEEDSLWKSNVSIESYWEYMMSSPLIVIEFNGLESLTKMKKMLGNQDPTLAEKHTFWQRYGKNSVLFNAFYCSLNNYEAIQDS